MCTSQADPQPEDRLTAVGAGAGCWERKHTGARAHKNANRIQGTQTQCTKSVCYSFSAEDFQLDVMGSCALKINPGRIILGKLTSWEAGSHRLQNHAET